MTRRTLEPYFLIVNPSQPGSCIKKWANNPQYRDPSFFYNEKDIWLKNKSGATFSILDPQPLSLSVLKPGTLSIHVLARKIPRLQGWMWASRTNTVINSLTCRIRQTDYMSCPDSRAGYVWCVSGSYPGELEVYQYRTKFNNFDIKISKSRYLVVKVT